MDSNQELETLNEIHARVRANFYALDAEEDEILEVVFLFSNIFGVKNEDGYSYFASGYKRKYKYVESADKRNGENMRSISPEDQKKARELERQMTNKRITKELKMKKSWDDKFKNTIKKQTTKKNNPFTVIDGGKK